MDNGFPTDVVLAEKTVHPNDIEIGEPFNLKETVVVFDQPVLCEANTEYCVVIMSDSQAYRLWFGQLGKDRVDSVGLAVTNPYVAGVMFSSSNRSTWTPHQDSDLTFKVYTANFEQDAVVLFDAVSNTQFASVLLAAETIDYASSGIRWDYKISGQVDQWMPITPYSHQEMSEQIQALPTASISLRCTLKFTNDLYTSMSSILAADCVSLSFLTYAQQGEYISRYCQFTHSFNAVRIQAEVFLPGQDMTRVLKTDSSPKPNITNVGFFLGRGLSQLPFTNDSDQPYEASNPAKVGDSADPEKEYLTWNTSLAGNTQWKNGFLGEAYNLGYGWWRLAWYKKFDDEETGITVGVRLFAKTLVLRPRMRRLMVSVSTLPAADPDLT
jgi:hypothetical protein